MTECNKPESPSLFYTVKAAGVALKDLYWAIKDLEPGEFTQEDKDYLLNRIAQIQEPVEHHTRPEFSKQIRAAVTGEEYVSPMTVEERRYLCHFHGRAPSSLRRAKRDFEQFRRDHPEYG